MLLALVHLCRRSAIGRLAVDLHVVDPVCLVVPGRADLGVLHQVVHNEASGARAGEGDQDGKRKDLGLHLQVMEEVLYG